MSFKPLRKMQVVVKPFAGFGRVIRSWLIRTVSRLKASSLWRFTLIHTAIVVILCGVTLGLVSHFSLGYFQKRQDAFVFEQLNALKAIAESTDQQEFLQVIDRQARDSRQALVVLKTQDGYFGNLNYLPDTVPMSPGIGSFMIFGGSVLEESRLQTVRGSRVVTPWGELLVAYNSSDFNIFAARFKMAVYVAILLALVSGLLTGLMFSRKVLGRLNGINSITRKVREGDLAARAVVSKRGDEFDELSGHINGMLNRIEDSVEAMRTVTDSIAHDLRTPLSRLKIRLDQLAHDESQSQQQLIQLQEELDTILHTFNAMLELTRLENSGADISFESCSLKAVCEEVMELAEPMADCRNQELLLESADDCTVQGNRQLLFRAIYNLVDNAMKYAPESSRIVIAVEQGRVTVTDEGEGIPESEQEKVFRRLYRLDASRTTKGYGLGLSLVKAVAELHSARVTLESKEPEGFAIALVFS